ncbi:MAG: Fpg/Nei family DNA glycosylase [Candidatus Dormibacteria bacterium]
MPEMPELEVLRERLGPALAGRSVSAVEVSPRFGFLLRTPPADLERRLVGNQVASLWRRGKFLVLGQQSGDHLVLNPMLGGRLHWTEGREKAPGTRLVAIEFEGGGRLTLTDFARMARLYLVGRDELEVVPGWSDLGPEASDISEDEFRARIRRHPGELKNLLRNQAFVAGIGNAYSDEVLFEARMMPLQKRATLDPDAIARLHHAMVKVLAEAVATIRAQPAWEAHKQDRQFMKVHMKGGQPCPRCGHRIAQLQSGGEITNFCRACQS